MSFYTKFNDVEPLLTSTTTQTGPNAADTFLCFSASDNRYHKTTFGAMGPTASYTPITTSTSTASPIPATNGSVVVTAAASAQFMLSTPAAAGIAMNFFNSSSTSTWTAIMSESTSVTFFGNANPVFTAGGGLGIQFSCSYQSFGIVSGFSTTGAQGGSWFVTYKSSAVLST